MTTENTEMDTFDRALVAELRREVVSNAYVPKRMRGRTRWAVAGGGIAAAAVAAFGLTALNPSAAYAVDQSSDGAIVITIQRLDDASGLEKKLADYGIDAEVDYDASATANGLSTTPPGTPPEGAITHVEGGSTESGSASAGPSTQSSGAPPADDVCGGPTPPMDTQLTDDAYVITIPKGSVLRSADTVLKITTSGEVKDSVAGLQVGFSKDGAMCGFGTMQAKAR